MFPYRRKTDLGIDSITAFHSERIDTKLPEINLRASRVCNTIQQDTLQNLSATSLINSSVSVNNDDLVLSPEQQPQNGQHKFLVDKEEIKLVIKELDNLQTKENQCNKQLNQLFTKKTIKNNDLKCLQQIIQHLQLLRQSLDYLQQLQDIQSKQQLSLLRQINVIKQHNNQDQQNYQNDLQTMNQQIEKQKLENMKLKQLVDLQEERLKLQSFIIAIQYQKSFQKVSFVNGLPTLSPTQQTHVRNQSSNNSFWDISDTK